MSSHPKALEALVEVSSRMTSAARSADWDELVRLADQYFSLFESARAELKSRQAIQIVRLLAENEATIREQVEPWLSATGPLLDRWQLLDRRKSEPEPRQS